MKYFFLFLGVAFITACNFSGDDAENQPVQRSVLDEAPVNPIGLVYWDTLEFVEYHHLGALATIELKKGNTTKALVVEDPESFPADFKRGDILSIEWKMDSLWLEDDGLQGQLRAFLISAKKIREGMASAFESQEGGEIKAEFNAHYNFSPEMVNNMRGIVEEYLASSQDAAILELRADPTNQFSFQIEEGEHGDNFYTVLGIKSSKSETPFRWLFVDTESNTVLEKDTFTGELVPIRQR